MDRGAVWKALGAPRDQSGSVNDPRTPEECGVKWNEKWVYPGAHPDGSDRVGALEPLRPARRVQGGRPTGACEPDPVLDGK